MVTTSTQVSLAPDFTTEAGFLETPRGRLFYVHDRPHRATSFSVLVASPILSEALKNNRREVLLSRSLASRGVPV